MEKKEKFERLKEIRGRIEKIVENYDGSVTISFIQKKGREENPAEFSMAPEDFRKVRLKGHLAPGMDIILWLDEKNTVKNMYRLLH